METCRRSNNEKIEYDQNLLESVYVHIYAFRVVQGINYLLTKADPYANAMHNLTNHMCKTRIINFHSSGLWISSLVMHRSSRVTGVCQYEDHTKKTRINVRKNAGNGNSNANKAAVVDRLSTNEPSKHDDTDSLAMSDDSARDRTCTADDVELRDIDENGTHAAQQDGNPSLKGNIAVMRKLVKERNAEQQQNSAEEGLLVQKLDARDLQLLVVSRYPDGVDTACDNCSEGKGGTHRRGLRVFATGLLGVKVSHSTDSKACWNQHGGSLPRNALSIKEKIESGGGGCQQHANRLIEGYRAVL